MSFSDLLATVARFLHSTNCRWTGKIQHGILGPKEEIAMNQYIKGETIKAFREKNKMTQAELAEKIGVTDKAVSKWETGRGLPDISLIEPIANAFRLSVGELFAGEQITNKNAASNMRRSRLYVCPVCGNVIQAAGDAAISCCGISLPALEAEEPDAGHGIRIESIEGELYVTVDHPMTKEHHISFIAYRTGDRIETVKLYPEGDAECRFFRRGHGEILAYCNRHGLFKVTL